MPQSSSYSAPHACAAHLQRIGSDYGTFAALDARHVCLFVVEGETLVVSFVRADTLRVQSPHPLPLGFDCVCALKTSLLSLICKGADDFQSSAITDLLSNLAQNGFFSSF